MASDESEDMYPWLTHSKSRGLRDGHDVCIDISELDFRMDKYTSNTVQTLQHQLGEGWLGVKGGEGGSG